MTRFGKVTAVTEEPVGTTLSVAASAGATNITVDDATQLSWPKGKLTLDDGTNSESRNYTIAVVPNQDIDVIDPDEDEQVTVATITLGSGLTNSYDVDTFVSQNPDTTEKLATVLLPDQQEEVVLRVPQHLTDRLPTGIRDEPTAAGTSETVELQQSENDYAIADVVSQTGSGFDRGYASNAGPVTVTADGSPSSDVDVICTVPIVIPTSQHRIIVSYSAHMTGTSGDFRLGFDDDGVDFTDPIILAQYNSASAIDTQLAAPVLPTVEADNVIYTPPGTTPESTADLVPLTTSFMAYGTTVPSVGLHTYRLVAWAPGVGGDITDASLWVAVI